MCLLLSKLGPKAPVTIPADFAESVPGTGSKPGGSQSGKEGGWQGFWRKPGRLHA